MPVKNGEVTALSCTSAGVARGSNGGSRRQPVKIIEFRSGKNIFLGMVPEKQADLGSLRRIKQLLATLFIKGSFVDVGRQVYRRKKDARQAIFFIKLRN